MKEGNPKLRFALIGAGFWASYQLAGWMELKQVECVAIYNRTRSRSEGLAQRFAIPAIYDDPARLIENEQLDFIDVVTSVETHANFVSLAAQHALPVICQKPMATSLEQAETMVAECDRAGIPFLINENWRWQTAIRAVKHALDEGSIGSVFRARIEFITGFPVFENQPFLKTLDRFILTDIGSHLLDVARFLFGEVEEIYCQTSRIHSNIAGEDVATVLMKTASGISVVIQMAYAENFIEEDHFPETRIFVEGSTGTLELRPGSGVHLTTSKGTSRSPLTVPNYTWADPQYQVVHSSIVLCQANLLAALQGKAQAETTGKDNLETVRLVFSAYDSARTGQPIRIG